MGAKSSAICLPFLWGLLSFLPLGCVKVLNTVSCWHILDSLGQKWSTGHSGMVFQSHVGATRILFSPAGKHSCITWRTLPLASKKAETAGLLTWRTTATTTSVPLIQSGFSLHLLELAAPAPLKIPAETRSFPGGWCLHRLGHTSVLELPFLPCFMSTSPRHWEGAQVLGSCDNFNRLTMTTDLHYQPPDQELSVCHHGQKNHFVLP